MTERPQLYRVYVNFLGRDVLLNPMHPDGWRSRQEACATAAQAAAYYRVERYDHDAGKWGTVAMVAPRT